MITPRQELAILEILDNASIPGGDIERRILMLYSRCEIAEKKLEQRSKATDREHLLAMIDEDRNEVLLLLADDALDRGDEMRAKGWGWLAATHRWPHHKYQNRTWFWARSPMISLNDRPCNLPEHLMEYIVGAGGLGIVQPFKTCRAAFEAVVEVIRRGWWNVEDDRESDNQVERKRFRQTGNSPGTVENLF
jgi:hypothetical protein